MQTIVIKAAYLGAHPEVFQIYKALVDPGLMSDEEFWRIRLEALEIERVSFTNRKGITVLQANRYALSDYLREQLLTLVPLVSKHVKGRARGDEGKVWEEFFSSRTYGDGSKQSSLFDKATSPTSSSNSRDYTNLMDAEYIMRKLNSLAASEGDRFEGFGNREEEYFEEPKITSTLMHEINLESVRQVPSSGNLNQQETAAMQRRDIVIPDLTDDLYFDGQEDLKTADNKQQKKEIYRGPLSYPLEFPNSHIQPSMTLPVITPLPVTSLLLTPTTTNTERNDDSEDIPQREHVLLTHQVVIEVLKHFWSAIPPMTVEKRHILSTMIRILAHLEAEHQHWRVRIPLKDQIRIDELMLAGTWEPVKRARQVYDELNSKK